MRPKAASRLGNRTPKVNVFRNVERTPSRYTGAMVPLNAVEQKERFLRFGMTPSFTMKGSSESLAKCVNNPRGEIRRTYLAEAKSILETVKEKYGDGGNFINAMFGEKIDYIQASKQLAQYLKNSHLQGEMTIYWAPDLTCSAKILWRGPSLKCNKPEARKYTLLLNCNSDNVYLRDIGIICLANHEIGTHYFRMFNDGFQPWFSDRKKFGLRSMSCRESNATEEGLATINTILQGETKYIWSAALLYYAACMAEEMTFKELFDHLGLFLQDKELRWRHVMRIKRGLQNPNDVGGYGNDQIYFEGAVEILRNIDQIDIPVLYSGKVCWDEVNRVKRLARKDCLRLPHFIGDLEWYKRKLRQIAVANGLISKPEKRTQSTTRSSVQKAHPFRRRKLIESGFVGSPSRTPVLSYRSTSRGGKLRRDPSVKSVCSARTPTQKLSAEVVFLNEKPSTSSLKNDDHEEDFNNNCSRMEYAENDEVEGGYEFEPNRRVQLLKRNGCGVYLVSRSETATDFVTEETFVLNDEKKYRNVTSLVSKSRPVNYSCEMLNI